MSEKVLIEKIECTGCGVCVTICPHKVIDIVDGKAEICLDCFLCGHCQAVCPEKAISLPQLPVQLGLRTVKEKNTIVPPGKTDSSELIALMRSRRSCRNYLDKAVDLAVLEDLVKVGITAPSGTNSQSWSFALIPKRADLQVFGGAVADYYRRLNRLALNPLLRLVMKIGGGDSLGRYYRNYYSSVAKALRDWDDEGIDRLFHGAAAAICVGGKKEASCPAEDALLATQNILLAAHTMGLGSCLIGFAVEAMRRQDSLKNQVGVADDEEVYSVIALGYPAIHYLRPANRKVIVPRICRLTETK